MPAGNTNQILHTFAFRKIRVDTDKVSYIGMRGGRALYTINVIRGKPVALNSQRPNQNKKLTYHRSDQQPVMMEWTRDTAVFFHFHDCTLVLRAL